MNDIKTIPQKLDPRTQQMLSAYAITPERDPESARRTQAGFIAELDSMFVGHTTSGMITGWSTGLNQLKRHLAYSLAKRSLLYALTSIMIFSVCLWSAVGVTAHAASSSLPGEMLYPIKTTFETARANLTSDPAEQARLYLNFAGHRILEMQSLLIEDRPNDLPQAASEYEKDIQMALIAIQKVAQIDPGKSTILRTETASVLRIYRDAITQIASLIPEENQAALQSAIHVSQLAPDGSEDHDAIGPTPTPREPTRVVSTVGPTSVDVHAVATDQANNAVTEANPGSDQSESSSTDDSAVSPTMTPMILILPTSPPESSPTPPSNPVIEGGDGTCDGFLGAVTVENLRVPQGARCTLDGTRVQGNIMVENGASLIAQRVTVMGNIQAEGAIFVEILAGSTVGGSIQIKQGGGVRSENVIINGDLQYESNSGMLSAIGNQVGGNVQVFQNTGSVTILDNSINGNLQCKENSPAPTGRDNTVRGNKEDQCAGL
jgi:hypothetical protein